MNEVIKKVCFIYTGGTIGMKPSDEGYIPVKGFLGEQLKKMHQFHDVNYTAKHLKYEFITPLSPHNVRANYHIIEYDPLLDSSNMSHKDWGSIAKTVEENYDEFDAFIIIHGTDTMAYTASALSFLFENLNKTVILTGAQIPISQVRNDGERNLLGALTIAAHYNIPEVCIYFNDKLYRGNRTTKANASGFAAFKSRNYPPLATVGVDVVVHWDRIRGGRMTEGKKFKANTITNSNVVCLRLFPGIEDEVLKNFTRPPVAGLVLETFGAGNAPDTRKEFLSILKQAVDRGVIIVNITQCGKGTVEAAYKTGRVLQDVGIISGADMTLEGALTKLMTLLSLGLSNDEIKKKMQMDLRGELTIMDKKLFSMQQTNFVQNVAKTISLQGSQMEFTGIKRVLLPVLICSMASEGSLDGLKSMNLSASQLNVCDYDMRTPLHLAASAGHLEVVKYLVEQGANLSIKDRFGNTPLVNAIKCKRDDVAQYLKEKGAKILFKPLRLGELLCEKAAIGDLETIKRFVEYGNVNVNEYNYDGRTALHLACSEGHLDIVKYLVSKNGNLTLKDKFGNTPIVCAKTHQQNHVVQYLNSLKL